MMSVQKVHATAIVQHGATISKGCTSPKRPGDTTDCAFTVGYNDAAGDTISIDEAWDVEDFGGDNVRVPLVGNAPIVAVSGNTTCTVAGALPCKIGKSGSVLSGLPGTAGNGSVTFGSNTYVIQANDPDPLPDQANAKVHDLCDDPNTSGCEGSSNTLQFTSSTNLIHPHTTLTKTADPKSGRAPLDVTYTYQEKNDGDDPISNVIVSDDKCSPVKPTLGIDLIHNVGDTNKNGVLDPGETWVFTCKATLNEITTNTATATGTASDQQPAPKETSGEVTVTVINPHTTLTKTPSATIVRKGDSVTYTYKEKNDGTDPITNVVVTDDKCSPVTPTLGGDGIHNTGDTNNNGVLDPGETWTYTCKTTLNDTTTNVATASGTASDDKAAPDERSGEVTVKVINPHTTLIKSADPTSGLAPLDVTYAYKEKNDGNDPISNVVVTDDKCSPVIPTLKDATHNTGDTNSNGVLDPGETWVYTCKAILNDTTTNTAKATGTASDDKAAPEETSNKVTVTIQKPAAPGRMTGGGSVFTKDGVRVTHGFELHCDINVTPNNLEINWDKGNKFHLDTLTSATCSDDPSIVPNPPAAGFDTYVGRGTGKYNGVAGATAEWTFTDAGEPGKNDTAKIVIKDVNNVVVLTVSGNLKVGNQQAH